MRALTRREWAGVVSAPFVAAPFARMAAQARSVVAGVRIGAQTYSFRDRPLAAVPPAFAAAGLSFAELWSGHVETDGATGAEPGAPREVRRARLRDWRLKVPPAHFAGIRRAFSDAGVTLTSYDVPYRDDWTDEEILRSFEMAAGLGVEVITSSAVLSVVPRVAALAKGKPVRIAFHNHSRISPNEFATPDDLAAAMRASPQMGVTLDIGHFTAANFDAVAFLDEHHGRIHALHIKDRRRDQGPNLPFGQGDTPIVAVLRRLRDRRWNIPAHIEYEYRGGDAVAEVTTCYDYCRKALETR